MISENPNYAIALLQQLIEISSIIKEERIKRISFNDL